MQLDQLVLKTFSGAATVTPDDNTNLTKFAYGLYVGTTGDLKVTMINGDVVDFDNVPVGIIDIGVKRVWSTGTTASDIVALYYK